MFAKGLSNTASLCRLNATYCKHRIIYNACLPNLSEVFKQQIREKRLIHSNSVSHWYKDLYTSIKLTFYPK